MAAGLGLKTFATGDILTAADTNGYLMQGVWVFADAAARTAAVTSPQEGNMSYLKDTNSVEFYSGSAWTAVGGTGKIKQVVSTNYSTSATTTSTTYVDTGLTLNITPTSATSTVLAIVNIVWLHDNLNAAAGVNFRLLRGATQINKSEILGYTGAAQFMSGSWAANVVDSPATTSATTYKAQFNTFNAASTVTAQYQSSTSTLTLIEIGA